MPPWLNRAEVRRVDLPSREMFWVVLLIKVSIRKGYDNGKVRNI